MRIPVRETGKGLAFNVTPLIDIVFLLIIFFLVTSQLVQQSASREVELPQVTLTQQEERNQPNRLVITVSAEGEYSLAGRIVPVEEVQRLIHQTSAETPVRFRTDANTSFKYIESLMHDCAEQGITDISFAVRKK